VLIFDVASITNGEAATGVLCQESFTAAASGLSATRCAFPQGLAYNPLQKVLYIADNLNFRVLAHDVASLSNGQAATGVLGQSDFVSSTSGLGAYKVSPARVAVESASHRLYVSDSGAFRILTFPTRYVFEYSETSFSEAAANDGSISTTVTISLDGDSFPSNLGALNSRRALHHNRRA
jgi:DNA-binding beta-propeller fold protein YncE